ncbi:MAG: SAVED domain-containing protein [Pyrinomonadaceae bacterium]
MTTDPSKQSLPASLLERQSRGGEVGEGGVNFQADVVLSLIPKWLADEGFSSLVRESIGDTEAKFFAPSVGYRKELVEAKNHKLGTAEFWGEIDRFRQIAMDTGGEYRSFTIACTGFVDTLQPLIADLKRIIGPYDFYSDSKIRENSLAQLRDRVIGVGGDADDAEFLLDRVQIIDGLTLANENGRALFKQSLPDHHPQFHDLSGRIVDEIYSDLSHFVRDRINKTITRTEIEKLINDRLPADHRTLSPNAIRVHTESKANEDDITGVLTFHWEDFSRLEDRKYPPAEEWNKNLLGQLTSTKNWMLEHRDTRRLQLTGERRLSAAVAFGFVFSAVSGFAIDMNHRGNSYSTDSHADAETKYDLTFSHEGSDKGERLIVSVGIIREIASGVGEYLQNESMDDSPQLHIHGAEAITSAEHANYIAGKIKKLISESLNQSGAVHIDLFIGAPSFLALFLGHRLNATAPVQCYEWLGAGRYHPTCRLFT